MSFPGAYHTNSDDETGLIDDSDADVDFVPRDEMDENEGEEDEGEDDDGETEEVRIGTDAQNRIFLIRSDGSQIPLDLNAIRASGNLGVLQALLGRGRGGGGRAASVDPIVTDDDDEDYVDEDDDDDDGGIFGNPFGGGMRRAAPKPLYPIVRDPTEPGMALERSGEFGPMPKAKYSTRKALVNSTNVADSFRRHGLSPSSVRSSRPDVADATVPNSVGTVVARFDANPYIGTWSKDGSFFTCATQDFRVRIYSGETPTSRSKGTYDTAPRRHGAGRFGYSRTDERSSLKLIKSIYAHDAYSRWTITDANLSPSNDALIYSSIGPIVNMVRTREGAYTVEGFGEDASDHVQLDFSTGSRSGFGIWSIRFSADAREIVAGASSGSVFAYDVERRCTTLRVNAHDDDVNAVAFADEASSNVLVSGSDDSFIKVWDRRSLRGQKPSGVLPGHLEGLTYLSAKGDGRYVVSNGKDQTCKLWDLRKMVSSERFDTMTPKYCGSPSFDYRSGVVPKPRYSKHPHDMSVMTFTGHTVLSTLIRCHFSPAEQNGQRYVYSGSADGRVHIWSLDGSIREVLDRRQTLPFDNAETGKPNDVFSAPMASQRFDNAHFGQMGCTVRDVSWHPREPTLISASWDRGRHGDHGSLVMHRWTGAR